MNRLIVLAVSTLSVAVCQGQPLENPGFEEGLAHWQASGGTNLFSVAEFEGRKVLSASMEGKGGQRNISQRFPVQPGEGFELTAELFAGMESGWSGMALQFFDEKQKILVSLPNWPPSGAKGWSRPVLRCRAPAGAVEGEVLLFINGKGKARWDNLELVSIPPIMIEDKTNVEITVTDEVVCRHFMGFGFEDDGWFYNEHNAAHGVDEADAKTREARIEWMDPDMVRMFFWNIEWCPAQDWKTFDWQTDDMTSKYRTLDVYQKIGATINMCGVEWGHTNAWPEPKVLANGFGELLEHLIKTKGYSCIKYWTLTNEPDGYFNQSCGDFDKYVQYHIAMKQEIDRRGLDVKIVGSDDMVTDWFDRCLAAPGYDDVINMYSTHIYIHDYNLDLADNIFAERTGKLKGKPWTIGEYGFRDHRFVPPYTNPFSEDYDYALRNHGFVIDGLNQGVASFQYWCIHEMYYVDPDNRMLFGLWNYKDRDWSIRPVYHSMASLCRLTEAGDTVYRCTTTQPGVKAARVGNVLFWVNGSATAKDIRIKGADLKSANIMAEDTLEGERECGKMVAEFKGNVLHVPPKSFGHTV
ncbi:MAG: hypothetical protein ABFR33_12040, partial [Verrucomicrobiota bacterium]